jgi:hypothetical protein
MAKKQYRSGLFRNPYFGNNDPDPVFNDAIIRIQSVECAFDNPDGVVGPFGLEGGPYEGGQSEGRTYSQGPGTEKGNRGNASGKPRTLRVKGGGFGY